MATLSSLLGEYAESHRNATNKLIHWVNVPLIYLSVVGLLWTVKLPAVLPFFNAMPLNAAMVVMLLVMVYYLRLSLQLGIGMLMFSVLCLVLCYLCEVLVQTPLWVVSAVVFVVAWAAQFVGHKIEGKKPSFFKDMQFFLIGPAWIMADVYRKLGVRY